MQSPQWIEEATETAAAEAANAREPARSARSHRDDSCKSDYGNRQPSLNSPSFCRQAQRSSSGALRGFIAQRPLERSVGATIPTKCRTTSGNTATRRDTETERRCAPSNDDAAAPDNEPPRRAAERARRHTRRGVGRPHETPSGTRRPITGTHSPDRHGTGPRATRHGDDNGERTQRRASGRLDPKPATDRARAWPFRAGGTESRCWRHGDE